MPEDFETLLSSRRYILGETRDYYGIWDRRARRGPFERFPLTAEGFDAAQARFRELNRRHRNPERLRMVLVWVVLCGVAMWLAAGVFTAVVYGTTWSGTVPLIAAQLAYGLDAVGYRLALGALFALAALFFLTKERPAGTEDGAGGRGRGWQPIAWWAMVVSLAAWVVIVLATRTLGPEDPSRFFFEGRPLPGAYLAATLIEGIAFRVWVAAAVLLALARLYGLPRARPYVDIEHTFG